MLSVMYHRGSDADGKAVVNDHLALGQRRLAIIDLDPRSDQPIYSERGNIFVYNGEVYNYKEIKENLSYSFKTESDTETILIGLEEPSSRCNMEFYMKVEKLVKPILLILVVIFVFIMSNSVITKGHDVIYDAKADTTYILPPVGYLKENSTFSPIEDEHYLTFYQDSRCSELTLVFGDTPESDQDVEVWWLDDSGGILNHYYEKWYQDKHIFRVEDIDTDVNYISLKIDSTFTIHQIMGSNPYHSRKIQMALFLAVSIFMSVIIYFIPTHKIYEPIKKAVNLIKDNKRSYIIFLLVFSGVLLVSVGLSLLLGYYLTKAKLTLNNFPISLNYRFVVLFTTLLTYIILTVIYRKKIFKHFPLFTFFTIMVIGFSFVMTESCCVGISWDDHIHYDWIDYLSHFADHKRTYAEWEMIDSYVKYPWYKDKVPEFYSYFDEYYKEGYFYRFEDYKFPFGKIVYLPMVLGFMFSRGLGLEFHRGFYFARLFEVAFAAILAALSVKRLRKGRIVILLIALIPTNIFITSNLSYDTWVTSWSILGFSFLFAEMQEPKKSITTARMLVIPLAFFLAV